LVIHVRRRTWVKGFVEKGAEKDIWAGEELSNRELERTS
jgi:hypothetical protein